MRKLLIILVFALAACGYEDRYAEGVAEYEPIYCYRLLTDIQCYRTPDREADGRLVNYYGPSPGQFDPPGKPPKPELSAPAPVDYWVKDREPIPERQVYLPVTSSLPPRLNTDTPPLKYPDAKPAVDGKNEGNGSDLAPAPDAAPAGEVRIESPE